MADYLLAIEGPDKGQTFQLGQDTTVIGRQGCDITLSDPDVSRRHAEIRRTASGYEIEDLGSSNGTQVDKIPVKRAGLCHGARIYIGQSVFMFIRDKSPSGNGHDKANTLTLDTLDFEPAAATATGDLEEANRARGDLAALYRVGRAINSTFKTEELVEVVLKAMIEEMPKVDACSLHLYDARTQQLQLKAHRIREGARQEECPVFSRVILNMVLQERKAVLTSDTFQDDRLGKAQSIMALNIRSAMCVPLQSRNRLFGVLQADVLRSGQCLVEDDLRLLAAIGMQAGTAFENAALFEQLAAEKAELEKAHEALRAAQDTLVRSEKLAAVGRLSAGILHDVKNPMTVILCHAKVLLQSLTGKAAAPLDDKSMIESLEQIEAGVMQCNSVMNGLLQFARQAMPEKTGVALNTLVEEIIRFLSYEIRKNKATVATELHDGLPPVFADAGQIKQVLLNLLMNAMQAMSGGGRITIATGLSDGPRGKMAYIRIRDTGCGMSPEVQSHLFEPFYSSKAPGEGVGGMGLGLSISHGIITNHGGTIEVESAPGRGTTFTVELPAKLQVA